MPDIEHAFSKLLGRQPSEREVQSLYRVRDALGLRDNDALWMVLIALESYDSLYRKYPEMISAQVHKSVDDYRAIIATIADAETKRALGTLSEAVARTSETIALRLVQAKCLLWAALATLAITAFGSFCTFIGFILGSGRMPYWAPPPTDLSFPALILSTMARMPAGWLAGIVALFLMIAACWHARRDLLQQRRYGIVLCSVILAGIAFAGIWPLL
jgi:hypothetical protein